MAPVRRFPGDPPPQYGPNADLFSVEIHHSGFFCGQGTNKTYVDERVDTFDCCEVDTWSLLWIEDFVRQCGYVDVTRLEVYWLLPGKSLFDGLRVIGCDADTNHMMSVVSKIKTFELYVNDKDLERSIFSDNEIPMTGGPELPKVLTPTKRRPLDIPPFYENVINPKQRAELQRKFDRREVDAWNSNAGHQFERRSNMSRDNLEPEAEEDSCGSEDSSSRSDFVDSAYEVDKDDDNLYEKYVDADAEEEEEEEKEQSKDKDIGSSKKKGNAIASKGKNLVEEEEELNLPDSDEEGGDISLKFKSFRPEDMENPVFKVGMVFSSIMEVRTALAEYAVKNRVVIKTPKNDKIRVKAHCAPGCPWEFFASKDSRSRCIMLKKYKDEHTCSREWEVKQFTASYIAKKYVEKVRTDEAISLRSLGSNVQEDYNMAANKSKLARAKREAIKKIRGDEQKQYNMLWDFAEELRTQNPGSTFYLKLKNGVLFEKLYMSIDACKRGFLQGCRPLICLDGCHLKTKHGEILLTAIGVDPNDYIIPIAIAVVEVENTITWTWLLKTLKEDLLIRNTKAWAIMSDRQKGLINVVDDMFPDSEHRICVRHLYQNFHASWKGETLKNQLWAIARSNNMATWKKNMEKMKEMNLEAWTYLDGIAPYTWCRAFFDEFPKCDLLLNNGCEVFNKWILDVRELPILSMLRKIKGQMMIRWYTNRKQCENDWSQLPICPKIKKKLDKTLNGQKVAMNVRLTKVCSSSRRWQLTGIPCSHSVACLRFERIKPEDKVAACYSIEAYRLAYGHVIMPCRDPAEWEKTNGPVVEPPKYEKKAGRKKKKRIVHPSEKDEGTRFSKHGVIMHCSVCNSIEHNRRKCTVLHPSERVRAPEKLPVRRNLLEAPTAHDSQCTEVTITQIPDETSSQTYSVMSTLLQEVEASQVIPDAPPGPLPECSFITLRRDELPVPRTTTCAQFL